MFKLLKKEPKQSEGTHLLHRVVRSPHTRFFALLGLFLVWQPSANAFCFAEASARYTVNEYILRAIALHESRMNPSLQLVNSNGSVDIGLMGINTVHISPGERLYRAGMTGSMLLDPCTNVMTGAYLLRLKMNRFGNTWTAVGAYHSITDQYNVAYQGRIRASLDKVMRQAQAAVRVDN
ncbi:lytic transglycosylase domain-containing protein [Polaromonas naphthalenivorans]|uniref:Lytic transglycosylase, catalytic n=1 Tax=Polaromonas naphthalenivorans (strain CJ2) TaxID=365044 RepID=A1VV48_POLNA|nr:lytic transglycosylase domain-containing protein [Polaromonas naphthalenivorans]ABM39526.1 Lytic transglycosylase, catalytic [Polaromonas naphthalenivorans CJ2]